MGFNHRRRVGLLRYGTTNELLPQGWQLDVEAAAFPRLDDNRNLVECDFRAGIPLTTRQGPWELKVGYVHTCSHIGDLYLLGNPGFQRINYTRDSVVWGLALYVTPDLRSHGDQRGLSHQRRGRAVGIPVWRRVQPRRPDRPLRAVLRLNGHLRQVNDFGGNVTVQTGWQWRGRSRSPAPHRHAILQRHERGGPVLQPSFEEQIGGGLWYDF